MNFFLLEAESILNQVSEQYNHSRLFIQPVK